LTRGKVVNGVCGRTLSRFVTSTMQCWQVESRKRNIRSRSTHTERSENSADSVIPSA